MSANPTFILALADATGRPVEVSPALEAATMGAAFRAGLATRAWSGWDDVAAAWQPRQVVEPAGTFDRERRHDALRRGADRHEDLSALDL